MREKIEAIGQHIFVISQISYKNSKKEIDDTNLGFIWNVLSPLIYMIILSTYYQNVMPHDIERFPVFIFIGIIIFKYYRVATQGAMKTLVNNKSLLTKSKLPIEIFVYEKILAALKELGFSIIALVPIIYFFDLKINYRYLLLIIIIGISTILIIGISKILAILYVFFADVDYLYTVFMTLLMFLSSVFVPLDHLPEDFQNILYINPIYISISLSRDAIMYNKSSSIKMWMILLGWAIVFFLIGNVFFNKNRDRCINRL